MRVEGTRLYRVREVAEHFGVSAATVYRAIGSGQLGALRLGSRAETLRITGTAVLAYAQACTTTNQPAGDADHTPVVVAS